MDKEDIIRMAREAQLGTSLIHKGGEQRVWIEGADWHDELERFAALVAAAEREACAKLAEEPYEFTSEEAHRIASAIRARGEQ
jgi:hypothetical protein